MAENFDSNGGNSNPLIMDGNRFSDPSTIGGRGVGEGHDPRVRIKPKTNAIKEILGPKDPENILLPLHSTGGVMFPYTPTIQAGFSVEYGQFQPVHSNQEFQAYNRTPSPTFTISGEFTAQTQEEGLYSLAVIHFFRTITKMYFGDNGSKNGITPPTLLLSGYGNLMFNNLPILINQYTIELVNNVDYVKVVAGSQIKIGTERAKNPSSIATIYNTILPNELEYDKPVFADDPLNIAWIPSKFLLTLSCVVNHTPKQMREFNLDDFRSGKLLRGKSGHYKNYKSRGGWW